MQQDFMKGNACSRETGRGAAKVGESTYMPPLHSVTEGSSPREAWPQCKPSTGPGAAAGTLVTNDPTAFSRRSFWAHSRSHHVAGDSFQSGEFPLAPLPSVLKGQCRRLSHRLGKECKLDK